MNSFTEIAKVKSTNELVEIIYAIDEWDPKMIKACENELSLRNQLPADYETKKREIIDQGEAILAQGKQASMTGLIFGWLFILGLIGLYIGYHYSYSKVISKHTGRKYFEYNQESRKNGEYILYASIFGIILCLIYYIIEYRGNGL